MLATTHSIKKVLNKQKQEVIKPSKYNKEQEIRRWKESIDFATKDKEYLQLCQEL